MSVKVEFKRVQTDEEVENIDIKDGQLIYTGTGKTYMDYGTERIPTGSGGSSVEVDTEMSDTSENAVQNKVIKEYVDSQTVPEEVIISDTQPTGDDWKLWIDSDEVQNVGSEITNEYSESTGKGYSANYINKIGTTVNLFGEIGGAESSVGNLEIYAHITATKVNYNTWKFEIEGQMDISNAQHQYTYGIMPSKISALLNAAISTQVRHSETIRNLGTWGITTPTTKLQYVDKYGYGTTFEFDDTYLKFARYYTTSGNTGSWALDTWENGSFLKAVVYLREV